MFGPVHIVLTFFRQSASLRLIIEKSAPVSTSAVIGRPSIQMSRLALTISVDVGDVVSSLVSCVVRSVVSFVVSPRREDVGGVIASRRAATFPPKVAAVSFPDEG